MLKTNKALKLMFLTEEEQKLFKELCAHYAWASDDRIFAWFVREVLYKVDKAEE